MKICTYDWLERTEAQCGGRAGVLGDDRPGLVEQHEAGDLAHGEARLELEDHPPVVETHLSGAESA